MSIDVELKTRYPFYTHESLVASMFEDEDNACERVATELVKSEVDITIADQKVVCLIDTGSDITCISETFWQSLMHTNIALLPIKPIQIRGAVGQKSSKITQLVLLPLKIGNTVVETAFLIVPNLIRPVILGFDWLVANKAILNLEHANKRGLYICIKDKEEFLPFPISYTQKEIREIQINKPIDALAYIQNIKPGVSISSTELSKLKEVLSNHKPVFTKTLGRCNRYTHDIKMAAHTPHIKRSYPVPYAYRKKMEDKLAEMEKDGIISREATPYSSPLTYTFKSDGSLRVLLDAREINKYMIAESEAPPMQIDILNSFHGVKYISIIDLNNAYFQIPISAESKKYTGFTFNGKSYCYNVLPQGLKTSVGSFSRAMDFILGPEVKEFCVNYLDDLAILTNGTLEEHIEHIDIILNKLQNAGLTCNIEKCHFICEEIKMLGHIITTEGIKTDPSKIDAIQNFPIPKKIKHLRAFLGLCNYYRRFIPNYSNIMKPLCKLLKKDNVWLWTPEAQRAFDELKAAFLESIMLHHPDMTKPFYLQTDSSGVGLAGVLYQYDKDGHMRIIGFCSKSLKGPELKWTVTEQEFWAVIYCLRKFETYLRGVKFTIRTDHKALTFIKSWKLYNSRIIRWTLYLEQFDYTVEHVKGSENVAVDILSRVPPDTEFMQEDKVLCPEINYMEGGKNKLLLAKLNNIQQFQSRDQACKLIMTSLNNSNTSLNATKYKRVSQYCKIQDNILYYTEKGKTHDVIVLPKELIEEIVSQVHLEMGHQGSQKILRYVRDRFYWMGMSRDIKNILRKCHICQLSKSNNIKFVGECQSIITTEVGDLVMADLYGPLPKGRFGAQYILVVQDSFSKFVKLFDLKKATAKAVLSKFKKFVSILKSKAVMTDNGSQFISDTWKTGVKALGLKTIYTTVRNPRPNTTERVNKELGRLFRTYCSNNHRGWATILPRIENLYNNTFHESTGFTPNEVVFGQGNELTIDKCNLKMQKEFNVNEIRERVRVNLKQASQKRKIQFNKSHKLITFQIGDLVKIRKLNKSDANLKVTKKFELLYEGPYVVAAVPFPNVYTLMEPTTNAMRGNFNTIHLSRYYK